MGGYRDEYVYNFIKNKSYEQRCLISSAIMKKHPGKYPIILVKGSNACINLTRRKFLVPETLTMSDFMCSVGILCGKESKEALYFLFGGRILATPHDMMENIYKKYKHPDGFLYVTYMVENSFG